MGDRLSWEPGTPFAQPPDHETGRLGRSARSRRLRLAIVMALVLVLVVVAATEAAWSRTRPLINGSTQVGVRICPDPTSDDCVLRTPNPGEAFMFGFTVRNRRSLPLTLLGVSFGTDRFVVIESLRMIPADLQDRDSRISAAVAFEPFVLHEGEERTLFAVARAALCLSLSTEGFGFSITHVTVRFRSLLATQAQVIRLPAFLRHELRFPYTSNACP